MNSLKKLRGPVLGLIALWGMAYLTDIYPKGHWSNSPAFFTGLFLGVIAVVLTIGDFVGWEL